MTDTIRADFHCHSAHSDGSLSPSMLAGTLASSGVRYAALTDHDTVGGLKEFKEACSRHGIAVISGLEMSVSEENQGLHLLAYGFDPTYGPLLEHLERIRAGRRGRDLALGASWTHQNDLEPLEITVEGEGHPAWVDDITEAVALIHQANGRAFIAHPLILARDMDRLDEILRLAKQAGADGLEAYYWCHGEDERLRLLEIAAKHGLLVCGGSDFHGPGRAGPPEPGLELPVVHWKTFRDALLATTGGGTPDLQEWAEQASAPRIGPFALRILIPSLLAIALFIAAIFLLIIPEVELQLMERKRELIRELTSTAWSVLQEYRNLETDGRLMPEEARQEARERIRGMRYGAELKDYFWITDMHPRMIMHPYRPDLEGQDLTGFADPNDVQLFVEFARKVKESSEGYTQYIWQWKDDPLRMVPKESYVRGFEPWQWVIGTGIYVDDVRAEIDRLTSRLIDVSAAIVAVMVLLLLWILQQSLRLERQRWATELALKESYEKYRTLVETAAVGTIMVLDGRCTYANAVVLDKLGYSTSDFMLLEPTDIIERPGPSAAQVSQQDPGPVGLLLQGGDVPAPFEARLRGKDGALHDVVISSSRIVLAGRQGFILSSRDSGGDRGLGEALDVTRQKYQALTGMLDLGVFHAQMRGRGRLLELNPAGRRILGIAEDAKFSQRRLMDYFRDETEGALFAKGLRESRAVSHRSVWLRREDGRQVLVSLSATMNRYGSRGHEHCDGVFKDITGRTRAAAAHEALIAELQTSLAFLNEPLHSLAPGLLTCGLDESISTVVSRMSRERRSAVAITAGEGAVVGMVTDRDFRERVLLAGRTLDRPIQEIMSAPVISIPDRALVYEAIILMQEEGVRHLAIRDGEDRVIGIVRASDLVRADRYSATVLGQQIRKARSVEEIAAFQQRLPVVVEGLLEGGASTQAITRIITTVSDAIAVRLTQMTIDRMGPPPVRFAILALGSEGRGEQTLATDQDNAIVYDDPAPEHADEIRTYFLRLATEVCDNLNEVGYAWCRGDLMAKNPRWCLSLSEWKTTLHRWITEVTPQDILDINKFFDFRSVFGDPELANALRDHAGAVIVSEPAFFKFFAENALKGRPPVGLFGQVVAGSGQSRPGTIDIKSPLMLIANFARLYALQHGLRVTGTVERLKRLHELGVTTTVSHREMLQAYDFLMRQRLGTQAAAIAEGLKPDNDIDPKQLTTIEQRTLKQVFAQISGMQGRISSDFALVE